MTTFRNSVQVVDLPPAEILKLATNQPSLKITFNNKVLPPCETNVKLNAVQRQNSESSNKTLRCAFYKEWGNLVKLDVAV